MTMRTRFAPSPNGYLHMGHALSAILAHDMSRSAGGEFHLRIEDIDAGRSKPEYVEAILADLTWLGLTWDAEPVFQSARLESYEAAAGRLHDMGLLYPCSCTRSEIKAAAREEGPEGPVYPGTCRDGKADLSKPHGWRLDMAQAADLANKLAGPLRWHDRCAGEVKADPAAFGDVILVRKDAPASYHLAATVDDAADGMTHIVRGMDLFTATHIHQLLQALLELPVPIYHHHALLTGKDGRKLSKSEDAPSLRELRLGGADGRQLANDLREGIFPAGISRDNP
ncbi:tRNA glutamyl-Q(34) synthetase GluQRS [Sphingorhabdus sp. Alg239-R122]|uniref:tRNA glutamyl-Q(34) synthetase GluQRS n=1 Tax=Sphingorhabdus sp. Alg239-R122 TaxID=2305989 RepID=UPI0013D9050E|nr:tRNA glutamyl-Q(34) synthetase GluQRS [Sphingorhabdus sp. Alg239-R122]